MSCFRLLEVFDFGKKNVYDKNVKDSNRMGITTWKDIISGGESSISYFQLHIMVSRANSLTPKLTILGHHKATVYFPN